MEETVMQETTLEEMDEVVQNYCREREIYEDSNGLARCSTCLISDDCESCYGDFHLSPRECKSAYMKIIKARKSPIPTFEADEVEENVSREDTPFDVIERPEHYNHGGMECIDEMILIFGKEAVMHFCVCNAWKYRKRAMYKNGEEDMKKSDWYMNKYKELSELVIANGKA